MTSDPPATAAMETCSHEPIHIPGSIQPHGALLVLHPGTLDCLQASANWPALAGRPLPGPLPGQPLAAVIGEAAASRVRLTLEQHSGPAEAATGQLLLLELGSRVFETVVHQHDSLIILEFAPAPPPGESVLPPALHHLIQQFEEAGDFPGLFDSLSRATALLTGYSRVMVYRFAADWHGEVVGETLTHDGWESYLGLHFPASDIPEQARTLYLKNRLRVIPDSRYTPAPILPGPNPLTGRPLDLSFSWLRSVSPVHLQYLQNMGVVASMSISLIVGGQLWGLIACHHHTVRPLPFHIRSACGVLGQAASLEIRSRLDRQRLQESSAAARIQTDFFDVIARQQKFEDALVNYTPALLGYLQAGGAVLYLNGRSTSLGDAPPADHLPDLLAWVSGQEANPVFAADSLSLLYPPAAAFVRQASGMLAVRLSPVEPQYVLFFRPELLTTITWAGDPAKKPDGAGHLHPRQSFAAWVQTVRGHSRPWTEVDRHAAVELRNALNALVLRRTERLISTNEDLERRNTDLQSFAHIAAHDLKEPLRGIASYSGFLEEDHGPDLNAEALRKVRTIHELAVHSSRLLEALARFSKIGRMEITVRLTDMEELLNSVLEATSSFPGSKRVTVRRPRPLPSVVCDPVLTREVFSNLIINAAKYNLSPDPWVEISWEENPANPDRPVFLVADNGIGIPEKHRDAVFIMFRRLHPQHAFGGGTGAGLAIARSIVERHGGHISVRARTCQEGEETGPEHSGGGSVFSFTLG